MNCRSKLWIVTCGEGHMIWVTTGTRKMKDASNRFDLSSQACGSVVKTPPANAGDVGWIPRLGRSPGEGNGNPLQYSCLENPRDGGAWWAAIYRVAQSWTRLNWLSSSSKGLTGVSRAKIKNVPAVWETRVGSLGWEDPLEKEMATHCSILAWRILWTKEQVRLLYMGSWRVRNN